MPIRQDREAAVNLDACYRHDLTRQQRRACHYFKDRAQARRDESHRRRETLQRFRHRYLDIGINEF
jgi:hypothetical protein